MDNVNYWTWFYEKWDRKLWKDVDSTIPSKKQRVLTILLAVKSQIGGVGEFVGAQN